MYMRGVPLELSMDRLILLAGPDVPVSEPVKKLNVPGGLANISLKLPAPFIDPVTAII